MSLRLILEHPARDVLLIRVRGVIDLATIPTWEGLARRTIQQRVGAIIVDVSKLEHISARGLKMLLALAAHESVLNGSLVVVGALAPIRQAARLVGLWDLAIEATSVRAALQKVEQHRAAREATRDVTKDVIRSSRRMTRQGGASG